jgi:H+-transporting ATPase
MFDPPREDTAATIAEAQKAPFRPPPMSFSELETLVPRASILQVSFAIAIASIGGGLNGAMAGELIEKANGFAEVFPEHKYQVVEMLIRSRLCSLRSTLHGDTTVRFL